MSSEREDRKREEILDKAIALFFERGIASLTMESLAARLGVSKVTLYKYFPGKDQLIGSAVERRMEVVAGQLEAMDRLPAGAFIERIGLFFDVVDQFVKPAMAVFFRDLASEAPWLWDRIQRFRAERVFPKLARLIEEGQAAGYVRSDLDKSLAATLLVAMAEQVARPDFIYRLPIPPAEVVGAIVSILLGGILNDKGRELLGSGLAPSAARDKERT